MTRGSLRRSLIFLACDTQGVAAGGGGFSCFGFCVRLTYKGCPIATRPTEEASHKAGHPSHVGSSQTYGCKPQLLRVFGQLSLSAVAVRGVSLRIHAGARGFPSLA